MTNVGEDEEKVELLVEVYRGTTALENSLAVPQNVKHGITIQPGNLMPS